MSDSEHHLFLDSYHASHTVIDDYTRNVSYNADYGNCDSRLAEGWYRFLLNGTNAVIPTSCVEVRVHTVTDNTNTWTDTTDMSMPWLAIYWCFTPGKPRRSSYSDPGDVCWLLNIPATCLCMLGTDLLKRAATLR